MFGLTRAARCFKVRPALTTVSSGQQLVFVMLVVSFLVFISLVIDCELLLSTYVTAYNYLAHTSGSCPLHLGEISKLPPQSASLSLTPDDLLTSWFFDPWLFLAFILPSEHQVFCLVPNPEFRSQALCMCCS